MSVKEKLLQIINELTEAQMVTFLYAFAEALNESGERK